MSDYLTVNRLEFIVTYRCNSHCKHCQVEDGARHSRPAAIDRDLAVHVVRQVAQAYAPRSVMTFGGEPLLYPDVVCAVHATATEQGIPRRDVITNAGTPRSAAAARDVALKLADSGVNRISISVDGFHQEYVPLAIVERNVRYYLEAGITDLEWNPCWLVSRDDDNPWNGKTRSVLQALAHLPVAEDEGNVVQPVGHARTWLAEFLPARVPMPSGSCGDMPYTGKLDEVRSITVEPDGQVAVCNEFTIGRCVSAENAAQREILDILQSYDPYRVPEMKALLEGGIDRLTEQMHDRGIQLDPSGYYSICDLCVSLRRAQKEAAC